MMQWIDLENYNPNNCTNTRRNALKKEVELHGLGEVILSLRMKMTTAYESYSRMKSDIRFLKKYYRSDLSN